MAAPIPALAEPSVLAWARRSQGLPPSLPARRLGVDESVIAAWEGGISSPNIDQLRQLAELYRRSLAVFFLDAPPTGFDTLRDFRRAAGSQAAVWSPALHEEYRRAHVQRDHLLELMETEAEVPAMSWLQARPGSRVVDDERFATLIRASLIGVAGRRPPTTDDRYQHANYWLGCIEESGVLVLHTRRGQVPTAEMRALSLAFDELPVVLLNGSDAIRGRLFSAMHEFVHLLLHAEGLCDLVTDERSTSPDTALEARCNAVAAAVLMPADSVTGARLVQEVSSSRGAWDYNTLAEVAGEFGTSAEALLLRLVTLGLADRGEYDRRRGDFHAAYEEQERASHNRGGNHYRNAVRDLGKGFVRRVVSAYERGTITSYAAATYLDAKVGQVPGFAKAVGLTAGEAHGAR
ncbi:MAG: hypothetical protein BGO38_11360 [Cellulomonas sp. 73-145]|uniref:XRE family transcriptional regulator n=1 Tax=Cellulomonas sp. 73-145 TaxID=1895739 RepID=UPI00092B4A11|nr:XRE family transcriptional regulator [Cellulomonas sp. 73-145]OJV57356.1 MAG: hypothetical protein BGO38_11360 [Cellulomonas sp. 73-145]